MKKIILLSFALCILLCSCGFDEKYECEIDNVESVQIVSLDKYVKDECRYEYTIISEVTNYSNFVNRLNNIDNNWPFGDPCTLDEGFVVIKINYHNGDYDLIDSHSQELYRSEGNRCTNFHFDQEQFDALVAETVNGSKPLKKSSYN